MGMGVPSSGMVIYSTAGGKPGARYPKFAVPFQRAGRSGAWHAAPRKRLHWKDT